MKQKPTSQKSQTDWARIDAMSDDDIDFSDIPRVTAAMFAKGIVRKGLKPVVKKQQLTLRIDSDVVTWFKAQGRGYQTQINELLRAYVNENKAALAKRRSKV